MKKQEQVAIIKALADVASQGTYNLKPEQARQMNAIFEAVAALINFLEKDDAVLEAQESFEEALEGVNEDDS